jgi:hypothetical protein
MPDQGFRSTGPTLQSPLGGFLAPGLGLDSQIQRKAVHVINALKKVEIEIIFINLSKLWFLYSKQLLGPQKDKFP